MHTEDFVTASLGERLAPLFEAGFFRPLARPSAAVYVDCARRLEAAVGEEGVLDRTEARLLVQEVIEQHPDIVLEYDEGGGSADPRQRATQFFNKLIEAQWIRERRVSLSEQTILLAPHLRRLLAMLNEMAENRPEELKDFGAGLHSVCDEISRIDTSALDGDAMRRTIKDLLDRTKRALDQMHAVESLIGEHETAQRRSASARETLQRFLDEFHVGEHMLCYDALRESGLLSNVERARETVRDLGTDPLVKERLAAGLSKHRGVGTAEVYGEAGAWLQRLETRLGAIPTVARLIDARMAEFSQLSAARYRYQTEMRGVRPEQVKAYCDRVADEFRGKRFADLANEPGVVFRTVSCEVLFGRESLAPVRAKRSPVNLRLGRRSRADDVFGAQDALRGHSLLALTPQRAGRFITNHLPEKGGRLSTEGLLLPTQDDVLDFLAVLTFDRAPVRRSARVLKWRVHTARKGGGRPPEAIPVDTVGDFRIERITIERTR